MAPLSLNWIQLAAVVGSLQGVLLTGVLLQQRSNRAANRILAALMAACTVYLASSVYYATGWFREFPHFFGFSYPILWVVGPLVYLYTVAASDRAWRFERQHLLHFVPAATALLVAAPYFPLGGAEKIALFDRLLAGDVPRRIVVLEPTKFVSGIAYSIATILHLHAHRRVVEQSYSNTAHVNLRWLLRLGGAAAGIWLLATAAEFTPIAGRIQEGHITLAVAAFVYAIGYMGLGQPEVFRHRTTEFAVPAEATSVVVSAVSVPLSVDAPPPHPSRYERSGLSEDEGAALEASLVRVMEREQPWKDSELTLPELAERIGSSPHKVSEVLNSRVGQTFYDFVNAYRVREVQRRIEAGDTRRATMLALALDAGFASKSTFNQAFKKHTHVTPSHFRSRVEVRSDVPSVELGR